MSFVAPYKTVANPPDNPQAGIVANDGWWPAINMDALRATCRFDSPVTNERLRDAVVQAITEVGAELTAWQTQQLAAGCATLVDVPSPQIGGRSAKVALYLRAVAASVNAQVADAYRDLDTLPSGEGKQDRVLSKIEIRVDGFRRDMRWAIADLQGKQRTIAGLI